MRPSETKVWPCGEHQFRLAIGELRALEQASNAGPPVILKRLLLSEWYIDDVIGVLRLGLIGAGMEQREAQRLIDKALSVASLYQLAVPAADILHKFIVFEGADQPGEHPAGAGQTETHSQTDSLDGQTSSPQEPPADSPQET